MRESTKAAVETLKTMGYITLTAGAIVVAVAHDTPRDQWNKALLWTVVAYLHGSITTLAYFYWAGRPRRPRRRTLDELTTHRVETVELPGEHTPRH